MIVENDSHNLIIKSIEMSNTSSPDFSELSRHITKTIVKTEKKNHGIYFTPPDRIRKSVQFLAPYLDDIHEVLEPACGTCEYITHLREVKPDINITGLEIHPTIFEAIQHFQNEKTNLLQADFLTHQFPHKYDLIIGNPPYLVLKKDRVLSKYYNFFEGRPNLFILFVIRSLELLNPGGIISFVLPKNFLNCLYYDKTRKHLVKNYLILDIVDCSTDKYLDTQQDTIILVIRNQNPGNQNRVFSFPISDYTILGTQENIASLKSLYEGSSTLHNLGFQVNVGNVVWNECKKELTDDTSQTLLVYSSDINKQNKLEIKTYTNEAKKNYIKRKGSTLPLLVINRGYGVGSYNFNYCILNENSSQPYLVENHLICIKNTCPLPKKELIKKYKKIIASFENEKCQEFIKLYFGNNAMNTTELCKILPIYDI